MEDMRKLIPRTPPAGLLSWGPVQDDLEAHALLYEAVWVENWGLEQLLDEYAKCRKIKKVQVRCSCCGESGLMNWTPACAPPGIYGFLHPDEDFSPRYSGEHTICPFCGAPVLVKRAAEVGAGYVVTDETSVMSAAVVGPQKYLALTCWTVQRRVFRDGREEMKFLPAEAYIFTPTDCVQLLGWRNSYGGNCGYFISYDRTWRQKKEWSERYGDPCLIYGLAPELVAESCLPHCKLDVYMETFRDIKGKYPIPYLRLYQEHPNVENLLLSGLPMVLDDLLWEIRKSDVWEKNRRGLPELKEINWTEVKPNLMLGLTKDELCLGRDQGWGALFWRLFRGAKALGELLTGEDIQNAYYLGEETVLDIVGQGPVSKSLRYLIKQIEGAGPGMEDEYGDPLPEGIIDVTMLLDYWRMCREAGRNLDDPQVRFPRSLVAAHDQAMAEVRQVASRAMHQKFRVRRRQLARYIFEADGLVIFPAGNQRDLDRESEELHHCVHTYGEGHATGTTAIFFIRRRIEPKKSFYTLELDEKNLEVRQNRGLRNCARTMEIRAFEDLWISWVRAGCRRDADGHPILPGKRQKVKSA